MARFFGLLARRAADPPRFRVARGAAIAPASSSAASLPPAAASLGAEPTAWRNGRAGDLPYDFTPDPVPVDERHPMAGLERPPADAEALAHLRALTTILRGAGEALTGEEQILLDSLDARLDQAHPGLVDTIAGDAVELLSSLDSGERGIGPALAGDLEEPLSALADLGFRAPIQTLDAYYTEPPDEPED